MADWSDFKPDAASSGWEGFQPDPPPSLARRALTKAEDIGSAGLRAVRGGLDIASGTPSEATMQGKELPPLAQGSDPLAVVSQHPYATAAAAGALTGPTIPTIAAMTEASPYISAAAGAIEQLGYQGIADISNKIGQKTGHPILGAVPGIVAPFAAPGLIERGLGTNLMRDTIKASAEKGRQVVQTVAEGAATKQEAQNLAAQTKLSAAAEKGLADFNDKIEAHAKDIYAQGEAAKASEAKSAESEAAKAQVVSDKATKEMQETAVANEKARLEREAEAQRGTLLGRTRAETQVALHPTPTTPEAGVAIASPEELTRKHAFRTAIFGERERTADYLGKKLDDFEKAHGAAEIPEPKPLKETLTDVNGRLRETGEPMEPSTGLQKLIKQARTAAGEITDPTKDPTIRQAEMGQTNLGRRLDPKNPGDARVLAAMSKAGLGVEAPKAITVSGMRDLRRAAQKFASGAGTDTEKDIATDIADAADRSLEHATGVPKEDIEALRDTNRHWRDLKENYKSSFLAHVSNEPEPVNVAKDIFNVPKRAGRLLTAATPEERSVYRNLAADWVNSENIPLHEVAAKVGGDDIARQLGWNPEKLKQFEPKLAELHNQIAKSPVAARDINAGVREQFAQIQSETADKLRKETIALARQLGPAGKQIETAMRNAMTPLDVQKVAGQMAQMSKDDFVKALSASQMSGEDAAKLAMSKVPLKGDAAREALLHMKPGRIEGYLARRIGFLHLYLGARAAEAMATGAGMHGVVALAAMDALVGGPLALRAGGRAMLKNPRLMDLAYKALTTPSKMTGYRATGRAIAELMNGVAAVKAQQQQDAREAAEAR